MLMKNGLSAGSIAAIALVAGSTLAAAPALAQTELRLHTFVPPGHIIFREILEPWAQEVEQESDGALRITLYPSMQLGGGAPELARQAQEGTVDMVFTLPGYTSAAFPRTQMFELPGLAEDGLVATDMMWELIDAGLLEEEYRDLKILALWAADDQNIYTRDTPIRSVDDMSGRLLRTPSAGQAVQLERLGATPVSMPITELYPQLERGVIDGALAPYTTILDFRMHEVANYYTVTGPVFGRSQFLIAMNQASFDNLAEEHQELIERTTGAEMSRRATETYLARADEGVEFVRDAGREIIEFDEEEQERVREQLRPLIDEWIEEMEGMGIDGRELLETAGYQHGG
jgi:TRAP-type transport system periplasmic protein